MSGKNRDELHRDARRGDLLSILRLTEAELDRTSSNLEELVEELVDRACRFYGYRDHRWRLRADLGPRSFQIAREALERRAARQPRGDVNPGRERVPTVIADTVGAVRRRRGLVDLRTSDAEVRYIAKIAAEYALGLRTEGA